MSKSPEKKLLKDRAYRVFTIDTAEEIAIKYFTELFGYEPEVCVKDSNLLWVGPIREKSYDVE